jgi:phage protein U
MKITLTRSKVKDVVEDICFFGALFPDWKIGLALTLYEIARSCEIRREYKLHHGQIQIYIMQVITEMFVTAKKELREERKNGKA